MPGVMACKAVRGGARVRAGGWRAQPGKCTADNIQERATEVRGTIGGGADPGDRACSTAQEKGAERKQTYVDNSSKEEWASVDQRTRARGWDYRTREKAPQ